MLMTLRMGEFKKEKLVLNLFTDQKQNNLTIMQLQF